MKKVCHGGDRLFSFRIKKEAAVGRACFETPLHSTPYSEVGTVRSTVNRGGPQK